MRIWREMGISLKSQCSTEPPSCSILGWHCRVPNKLVTLHNNSPACRVLPLEVLWLEFKEKIFKSYYRFLILGIHKTNPRSSKPRTSSSDQQEHRSCKPDQYIKKELEKYFEQKMLTVHPSPVTALILNQETVRNNHKYTYTGAVKTETKPNP